jgi:hypothetical protein
MSLCTGDQKVSDISEAESAGLYTRLCEDKGVKATLYATGRLFAEEWNSIKDWVSSPNIEVGGHTFNAFMPAFPHRIWKKLTGNYNGPAFFEGRDIERNLAVIEDCAGIMAKSWRNHCYFHGVNTDRLLIENGLTSCSDLVTKPGGVPFVSNDGLLTVPINVIPDHEHIYHGDRTKEQVDWWVKRYKWSDAYGIESYSPDRWFEIVLENIEYNERLGITSVILAHPLCMYVADRMEAFKKILDLGVKYGSCTVAELVEQWWKGKSGLYKLCC